jgi:hypothetical protein
LGYWPPHLQLFAANLNGDRLADMLLHNHETGEWLPGLNTGDGRFRLGASAWAPLGRASIGDFDGDGRDDVLVADRNTGLATQCLTTTIQAGLQTRLQDPTFTCHAGDALPPGSVLVSDFTGDGLADVFIYDASTGHWTLGVNDGAGTFGYVSGDWSPGSAVRAADLDGDRRADLLFYDPTTGRWETWGSRGPGGFQVVTTGTWAQGLALHLADFTGDGRDEALLYEPRAGAWAITPLTPAASAPQALGNAPPRSTLATGDVDADGYDEAYVYEPRTGFVLSLNPESAGRLKVLSSTWPVGWTLIGREQ